MSRTSRSLTQQQFSPTSSRWKPRHTERVRGSRSYNCTLGVLYANGSVRCWYQESEATPSDSSGTT